MFVLCSEQSGYFRLVEPENVEDFMNYDGNLVVRDYEVEELLTEQEADSNTASLPALSTSGYYLLY